MPFVERWRGKPWHVDYGDNPGLVPDRHRDIPEDHAQEVYSLDVLMDNVMVAGTAQRR